VKHRWLHEACDALGHYIAPDCKACKIADPNLFFAMSFNKLCTSVKPDSIILMENGFLPFKVEPVASDHVMGEVMSGGSLQQASMHHATTTERLDCIKPC